MELEEEGERCKACADEERGEGKSTGRSTLACADLGSVQAEVGGLEFPSAHRPADGTRERCCEAGRASRQAALAAAVGEERTERRGEREAAAAGEAAAQRGESALHRRTVRFGGASA